MKRLSPLLAVLGCSFILFTTYTNCSAPFNAGSELSQSSEASSGLTSGSSQTLPGNPETATPTPAPSVSNPGSTTPQTGPQTINVAPSASALNSLQSAINQAISSGRETTIRLSAGNYSLQCTNTSGSYCLVISGASNLKIEGVYGATKLLVEGAKAGALLISGSNGVAISNLSIDYSTPPFSQGTIQSVSSNELIYGVDTNFPTPVDSRLFNFCSSGCEQSGHVFNSSGSSSKANTRNDYVAISGTPENLGGGVWRLRSHNSLSSFVSAGDKIAVSQRNNHAVVMQNSSDITLSQVDINTSPHMAVVVLGGGGTVLLDRVRVLPTPGSGRVISSTADGIHVMNSRSKIIVRGGYFTNMGDDAINVKVEGMTVVAKSGSSIEVQTTSLLTFKVGDYVQVMDSTRNAHHIPSPFNARVQSVSQKSGSAVLSLQIETSAIQVGDIVFNASAASSATEITNNTFGSFRGAFRLRGPSTVMSVNSLLDSRTAHILFSVESYWNEGPMPNPTTVSGNSVSGGRLKLFGFNWAPYAEY